MSKIQVFVPTVRTDEALAEIRECFEIGWTGMGFKTAELEEAWKAYTGEPHAHFLNSATAALHIALAMFKKHDGWADGDEVITTPLTFVSSNHAILYENLTPVFADIDHHLCLDPASVEARITPRTRAVMFVGLGGNTGQLKAIWDLCQKRGLRLILDAAHMAGTRLDGRFPWEAADVTCYSYQAVKNMPTADSGMVCFKDEALDKASRRFSWLGISKDTYARSNKGSYAWRYDVDEAGYKYNGNAVMAAIGLVSLRYLDADNARRRAICARYDAFFEGRADVTRVPLGPGCESSRHLYQLLVDRRDDLVAFLNERGVFPGVHYVDNTEYRPYAYGAGTCPAAALASSRTISLPLHLKLSEADIDRVCRETAAFLDQTD